MSISGISDAENMGRPGAHRPLRARVFSRLVIPFFGLACLVIGFAWARMGILGKDSPTCGGLYVDIIAVCLFLILLAMTQFLYGWSIRSSCAGANTGEQGNCGLSRDDGDAE